MSLTASRTISLSIPADPGHIATVRSFAFAVARHESLPGETVEDLKLALSEIVASAIEDDVAREISIVFESTDDLLEVSVRRQDGPNHPPRSSSELDRRSLMEALFPTISTNRDGSSLVTSFRVERG